MLSRCGVARTSLTSSLAAVSSPSTSLRLISTTSVGALASSASSPSARAPEEAGFVRGLFCGEIRAEQLLPFPEVLSEDEKDNLSMMVEAGTKFFDEVNHPAKNDENEQVDPAVTQQMKEMGLFGLQVPVELGGIGLSNTGYARMAEIMAATDLGATIFVGAHQSIGFKGILIVGTEEQKKKYLPRLATGEDFAAFALTEPSSGSDAMSIRSKAKLSADGKHYILNGSKLWISNGGIAEIFTVFAQTDVKDPVSGEVKEKMTAFIVERKFGGVTNGPPEKKMGIKASNTAEVFFDNTHIPVENVLGGVGKGFKVAMNILNNGRFGMVAGLTGTQKYLIKTASAHATTRVQFGHKLMEYQLTQFKFADMALRCYASESLAYMISGNMDKGSVDYQLEAAIGKIYASEAAWHTADECLQVMGGLGFMKALPFERIVRDLRIFRIFEGANDILRQFIALTGMQATGEHLKKTLKAAQAFDTTVLMREAPRRLSRTLGLSVKGPALAGAHPNLAASAQLVSDNAVDFGFLVEDLARKHGKKLVEKQRACAGVADAVIELYAMAAVVSRASMALTKGLPSAAHEQLLASTYCTQGDEKLKAIFKSVRSGVQYDSPKANIANAIFKGQAVATTHPLMLK